MHTLLVMYFLLYLCSVYLTFVLQVIKQEAKPVQQPPPKSNEERPRYDETERD